MSFSRSRICQAPNKIRPRTGAGVSRQAGYAARAASTACRVSSALDSGTSPSTSRVFAGFQLSAACGDADSSHSPAMKLR